MTGHTYKFVLSLSILVLFSACGSSPQTQKTSTRHPVESNSHGNRDNWSRTTQNIDNFQDSQIIDGGTLPDFTKTETQSFTYSIPALQASTLDIAGVDFDYEYAAQNLSASTPKIRIKLDNADLLSLGNRLGIVIGGASLSNTAVPIFRNTQVTFDSGNSVIAAANGFEAQTIYKLTAFFFDITSHDNPTFLGRYKHSYYLATDGEAVRFSTTRAQIATKAMAEAYDWDLGREDRSKGYTKHGGGGWCHVFYNWAIKDFVPTRYNHHYYSQSPWKKLNSYYSGNEAAQMSATDVLHGDLFGTSGHRGMILAYDNSTQKFFTVEGNFNNRVKMWKRRASEFWLGHLVETMNSETMNN